MLLYLPETTMTHQKIISLLPAFYKKFLPAFFETEIPKETASTCSDCAMWADSNDEFSMSVHFSKETKCCTHYPNLPNYLVGALLSNRDPKLKTGQNRLRRTLNSRLGVVPLGIRRTRKYEFLMKKARHAFGKSRSMVCPFFKQEGGLCTLRPFWNAICSTWFCKYNAGQDGQIFWLALRRYMVMAEEGLSQYVLYKLGFEAEHILLPEKDMEPWSERDLDDQSPEIKSYQVLWEKWAGREEDLYKETYNLIQGLSRDDFTRIAGVRQDILLNDLENRYNTLIGPKLPCKLKRNPRLLVEKTQQGAYVLISYSPYDSFEVSKRIYDMLNYFDGRRSNEEACRLIRDRLGAEPTEDLLVSLYQFRILIHDE